MVPVPVMWRNITQNQTKFMPVLELYLLFWVITRSGNLRESVSFSLVQFWWWIRKNAIRHTDPNTHTGISITGNGILCILVPTYTLPLRHNREYFVKYRNILLANPTDGLKYGEHQLEYIWRWLCWACWSQVYGQNSCKTHYIEESEKPTLP